MTCATVKTCPEHEVRAWRRWVSRGAALVLWASLVLAPTANVAAQGEDADAAHAASARSLFSEGVELADQSRWAEAADRFRRALALRDSPVIAYNLASALKELGKLVEASEMLRRISSGQEVDAELRKSATSALAEVTPRIGRITVHAEGRQDGDLITIDDQALFDAQLDVAVPIDPGAHLLVARRGQETLESRELMVNPGEPLELTLQLARAPAPHEVAVAAPPAPLPSTATEQPPKKPVTEQWWFWTGVGTAVVGVVVVAALVAAGGGSSKQTPAAGTFDPMVLHVVVK
jgi:hypothetical protein